LGRSDGAPQHFCTNLQAKLLKLLIPHALSRTAPRADGGPGFIDGAALFKQRPVSI
jgi:hypothetical protein